MCQTLQLQMEHQGLELLFPALNVCEFSHGSDHSIPTEWRKTTEQDVSNHARCPDVHFQAIPISVRDMVREI